MKYTDSAKTNPGKNKTYLKVKGYIAILEIDIS